MRILFVTPYIPSLIRVRPYNLIRALASLGHQIHLVSLQPPEDRFASVDPLRDVCQHIDVFPLSRAQTLRNGLTALPSGYPLQAAYSHHPQAERHLYDLAASGRFDVLHVEHLRGAVLVKHIRGVPRIFDSVDSISYLFDQARRHAPRLRQRLMAAIDLGRTRRFEARAPLQFDRTLVTSPADAHELTRLAGRPLNGRLMIVPNGVDLDAFHPATQSPEPDTILFSGKMSYHANAAAALYLANEIMPLVWKQRPTAKLLIVGKDPSPIVRALAEDSRIEVTGFVESMPPYFARATLAVSPLRYGAGIQNKVLEAMACGLPVVTTPNVCDALRVRPDRDLLVAGSADQLACHILNLINDPALSDEIGRAGRRYVEHHHHWPTIAQNLTSAYEAVQDAVRQRVA